jgi:protein involved in polysaccharide export with SLBB domain
MKPKLPCSRTWRALVALTVSSCALLMAAPMGASAAEETKANAPLDVPAAYRLQAGDEVSISVLPRNDYDSIGTVLPDGTFHLKNVGPVRMEGLTLQEVTLEVTKQLERLLRRPRINVTLLRLARPPALPQITVVGAVGRPGPQVLVEGLRVRKAIELAGGTTTTADLKRVLVVRSDLTSLRLDLSHSDSALDPDRNPLLLEGDSIDVPALARVTVTGELVKPGELELNEGLRLRKALDLAGGPTSNADLTRITVVHRDLTQSIIDLSRPELVLDAAHNRLLRDGDSVEVPPLFQEGSASISGAVQQPGSYPLKPRWTMEDLIVAAGRLALTADVENVALRRRGQPERRINLREALARGLDGSILLQPDDQVFIPAHENTIVLIGPIAEPGLRPLTPGHTLRKFFIEGSPETLKGLDPSKIDMRNVRLIREGRDAVKINLVDVMAKADHPQNLTLAAGDVVFLPPRDPAITGKDYLLRGLPVIGTLLRIFTLGF